MSRCNIRLTITSQLEVTYTGIMITNITGLTPLQDISDSGRPRPWRQHKIANTYLSMAYQDIDPDKAVRLSNCATYLTYTPQASKLRLTNANFCRVRLCPMCQWRRSIKAYAQASQVIARYEEEGQHEYAMLTLTLRNCTADELSCTIDDMMRAWSTLRHRKEWQRVVLGYYRGLEVTHNVNPQSPSYDTYHPHFHALLALPKSYYNGHGRNYITQSQWTDMWRAALRADYTPIVDIRKCRLRNGTTAGITAEVTKYTTKPSDYIIPDDWDLTVDTVRTLDAALHKRRFAAWGGRLKEIHQLLHLDDIDSGDLVHVEGDSDATDVAAAEILYCWYAGYRQYYS